MCKTNHYGHGNLCREYSIDDTIQGRFTDEKDLGVMVSSLLKPSSQHVAVATKAMSATIYVYLGALLSTSTKSHSKFFTKQPDLEFCISTWCTTVFDTIFKCLCSQLLLAKVQRRVPRMVVPTLKNLECKDRLRRLQHVGYTKI